MRIRCWLLGCDPVLDEDGFADTCRRCGRWDDQPSLLPVGGRIGAWLRRLHWRTFWRLWHRCEWCGKSVWFTSGIACSQDCLENSLPF